MVQEMLDTDSEEDKSLDRLTELILVMLMVLSVTSSLASAHLETVARKVLDDEAFMEPTAHALFASLFFVLMRFSGWIKRLAALYESHGEHPIVKELVISLAISNYRSPQISDSEAEQLGEFLAGLANADNAPKGVGNVGRARFTDGRLQQLRESRQKALMARALGGNDDEDGLDA